MFNLVVQMQINCHETVSHTKHMHKCTIKKIIIYFVCALNSLFDESIKFTFPTKCWLITHKVETVSSVCRRFQIRLPMVINNL